MGQDKDKTCCLFLEEEEEDSPESSSSIGAPDDTDEESEGDDAVSADGGGGLGSLGSLNDSLPIKRGLSNHYMGKSKSFANLSEVSSLSEMEKSENPFNKKRRILRASKWSRRSSSLYSWQHRNSMPLLASLNEDEDDGEDEPNPNVIHRNSSSSSSSSSSSLINDEEKGSSKKKMFRAGFKSQSCFSLTVSHEGAQ